MQPDHILGARGAGGDLVHIKVRGIGGQDRALLADRVQLAKDLFLDTHLLEDRLDHQVHVAQRVVIGGQRQRLAGQVVEFLLADLTAFQRALQVARNPALGGLGGLRSHFQHDDRQTGQQRRRGDPRPHGAAADNAKAVHRARFDAFQFRQFADRPLREEGMDHALTLIGAHQFHEEFALALHALVKGQLAAGLDAAHRDRRRQQAAALLQNRFVKRIEINRFRGRHFADGAAGRATVQKLLRVGQSDLARLALFDTVQNAEAQRFLGADLTARGDDVHRGVNPNQARQTLGATGARHHADQNFGQTHTGRGHRDAVMRSQRDLQTAAQRGAMQGRDNQKRRGFDSGADIGQERTLRRLAEFADISACKIGAALSVNQHRLGAFRLGALDAVHQPLAHIQAQRVHRRILRLEDRNIPDAFISNGLCHSFFLSLAGLWDAARKAPFSRGDLAMLPPPAPRPPFTTHAKTRRHFRSPRCSAPGVGVNPCFTMRN